MKIVKISCFQPSQKLTLFIFTQLSLQHDIVANLPDVVVVRSEWIDSKAADGRFKVGSVAILSSKYGRRRPWEKAFIF